MQRMNKQVEMEEKPQHRRLQGREVTIRIPAATWERVMTLANQEGLSFDEMAKDMFLIGYDQIKRSYGE